MNINFRPYTKNDFNMINDWLKFSKEIQMQSHVLPEDSSFILELDNIPTFLMTIYFTNSKELCFFENLISNPEMKRVRKPYLKNLFQHLENVAKENGYKKVMFFSRNKKTTERYKDIGYDQFMWNLDCLGKEL